MFWYNKPIQPCNIPPSSPSGRTFPSHPYFSKGAKEGQSSLYSIMHAYAVADPEIGYCQGLSFLTGMLLMHVSNCVQKHQPSHTHFPNLALNPGSPFRILSHGFGEKFDFSPKLWDKIQNGEPKFEAMLQSCETKSGTESLDSRLCLTMHFRLIILYAVIFLMWEHL